MQSILLKQFNTPSKAVENIQEAQSAYLKAFKRNLKTELAYSEIGQPKRPQIYVAAWYDGEEVELDWLKRYFAALK